MKDERIKKDIDTNIDKDINKNANVNYNLPDGVSQIIKQVDVAKQSLEYIKKRANGEIQYLKTGYYSIDYRLMSGGFEPNSILVLSGLSGSGKSTLSKRLIYSIHDNMIKHKKKVKTLCFNFEMLALKTFNRELANVSRLDLNQLYSTTDKLDDSIFEELETKYAKEISKYHIDYVENPITVSNLVSTVYYYWNKNCNGSQIYNQDVTYIVEIDHTMLTKQDEGQDAKKKVDELMEGLVTLKKRIHSMGGNIFFIVISQMNRDIKSSDRIKIPNMQRPMTSDLFQSSTVEHCADYIIVAHNPSKLNLQGYTEDNLPINVALSIEDRKTIGNNNITNINKTNDINNYIIELTDGADNIRQFIYFHLLKCRDGEPDKYIAMINDLRYFNYIEVPLNDIKTIINTHHSNLLPEYYCIITDGKFNNK